MLQVGFFSRRTAEQMDLEGAGQELEDLAGPDGGRRPASPEQVEAMRELIEG